MCGIVGVISDEPIDTALVERMRDELAHRGPDNAGLWTESDGLTCLGHRRLAVIDRTPDADQPFISSDGRFVLTFNGEIYNFRALRRELESRGVGFRTQSDTEVLLEAFRFWGEGCPRRLEGMFAFGIWDRERRRLFCSRDRAGEKPFHYTTSRGVFLFASELKALVLWPNVGDQICYPALADYLAFGYVPDPKTIWEGCLKLPPGHSMWVTEDGAMQPTPYWDLEFDPRDNTGDWDAEVRSALEHAVRDMSYADVPVGVFLSGGVDSSSVTAALARSGAEVRTFTIGFHEASHDERAWARQVADCFATSHTERVVEAPDIEAVIAKLLFHYDEPFNDPSYLPTYVVCREARRSITVALSGDGGDELFCGYTKYRRLALRDRVPALLSQLASLGTRLLPPRSTVRNVVANHSRAPADLLFDMVNTGIAPNDLIRVARGPLAEALRSYSPLEVVKPLLARVPVKVHGLVNAMRYLDLKLTLAGDMLVKVDRASMAVSLEVRPAYLHRSLLDLAGSIPSRTLVDHRRAKKLLRSALRSWLPAELLDRQKVGFGIPIEGWGVLEGLRAAGRSNGPLNDLVDPVLASHMASLNGSHGVWFLERWFERWT